MGAMQRASSGQSSVRGAWLYVGALTLLYALSISDRQIIGMVIGAIKKDLGVGDFGIGLLAGPVFTIAYVLFGVPCGWLADRWRRPWVLALGILVFSLATLTCGLAGSLAVLILGRAFVGVGEAAVSPVATSLIAEYVGKKRLGLVLSLYQLGAPLGGALALFAAGAVLRWSGNGGALVLPVIGAVSGWRLVFVASAAVGLVLTPLALILPEPRGRSSAQAAARPERDTAELKAFIRENRTLLALVFVGFSLASVFGLNLNLWAPELLSRDFHVPISEVGTTLAAIALLTPISSVLAGAAVDYLFARGVKDAVVRLYTIMLAIGLPLILLTFLGHSLTLFYVGFGLLFLLINPSLAFALITLQLIAPNAFRGRVVGAYLATISAVGAISISLVGFLSGLISEGIGAHGLAVAMTLVLATTTMGAIGFLVLAMPALRRFVLRIESQPD
jgi:MFS family permease